MKRINFYRVALLRFLAALFLLSSALVANSPTENIQAAVSKAPAVSRVAYIYGTDPSATANAFNTFLTGRGITVDLFSDAQAALATADFSPDDTIIIGDDMDVTGGFFAFDNIQNSGKPVVAIGNWGSQFLIEANLPMISGGTGFLTTASDYAAHVADPYAPVWSSPSPVSQINQYLALYTQAVSVYGLGNPAPIQFSTRIGRLPGDPNHYSLIADATGARCYSYWGYRGLPTVMTPSGMNLFLNMVFGSPCTAGSYTLNSVLASTAPVMDGSLDYGEWSLTPNRLEMDHGFAAVMNDNIRLYLMMDVLESSVNNSGANENDFWVSIDTNNDGLITPGVDLNYALVDATHNMRYQHYVNPAQWDSLSTTTLSSLGPGFDCYSPDNTRILNINTQQFDCSAHQIWEIAIDLKEINALPGQTIHIGLRTSTPNPEFTDELPNSFDVDFSNLITVHLASMPIPPHDPNANIAFATPSMEITQVVQDVNNNIPLVANKATAGRVAVVTTGASTPQPVLEYLYGQRGGNDLPGSPLVKQINAPLAYDRSSLTSTANFMLPGSWTNPGENFFHVGASDFNGHTISTSPQLLPFQAKAVPVYWFIQENNGTANAPDLPSLATIASYESYVKTVFPVPDATFVLKPWTVLGALNGAGLQTIVDDVAQYYNAISAVYWNAVLQNQPPPFALPELIFAAGDIGGGLSDPTWYNNGGGHAAAGGNASSGEGVAAHEFNHDLDRSSNGTWGRHVGACGAQGPDPNWPNGTNPAITEYGFDTRLPWQNTNVSKTIVPPTFPDLMSYCGSGMLPTKWISPYRYRAWFSSPLFPAAPQAGPVNSIYINGSLDVGGSGALDPAFFAPGMPISPSASGAYSVQLSGPGIMTITHSFDAVFQDVEGNPLTAIPFHFVLADPGGVTTIQLRHGAQVLDTLNKAAAPPSAAFTAPAAGALAGQMTVSWNLAAGDVPPAGLRQQLDFSTDGGTTWMPVAFNLPGTVTAINLDTSLLPMTSQGRLRLIISDGLNNVTVDSPNVFSVGNHPPLVNILAPFNMGYLPGGTPVALQGEASDVDEPSVPDSHFQWTMDGSTTLGVGRILPVTLPNGQHNLTLTVLDSGGATASTSVTVFVNQRRVLLPLVRK
jgi:hypothetical protein